jgi:hypothetical protein
VDTTTTVGATTAGDDNDDELMVVIGHPRLRALWDVSLSEVMSVAHFTLCQAQGVLQRERTDVEEE